MAVKKRTPLMEAIFDQFPDTTFLIVDGHDDALMGVVTRFGMDPILCYDLDKVVKGLMRDGMDYEEAVEFFDFNIIGAWVGDSTPCFITRPRVPRASKK